MGRGACRVGAGAAVLVCTAGVLIGAASGFSTPRRSPREERRVAALTVAVHRAPARVEALRTASGIRNGARSAAVVARHPAATVRAPGRCITRHLRVTLGRPEGAAGSTFVPLVFSNTGPRRCSLRGYPGVSAVTRRAGAQIGAAATWSPIGARARVVLEPGARASALLQIVEAANYPAPRCRPRAAAGLRVFPPGATVAAFVAVPHLVACSSRTAVVLSVRAVVPG